MAETKIQSNTQLKMEQFQRMEVLPYTSMHLNFSNSMEEYSLLNQSESGNIIFQGKLNMLETLFAESKTKLLNIFRSSLSADKYNNVFIELKETFHLTIDTIPQLPEYYLERVLPNKYVFDESIFKIECPDIFVFEGLERYRLSLLAGQHLTSSSSHQVENVTCRFIHLEYRSDWETIKQKVNVPAHLIKYDEASHTFSLEESCRDSTIFENLAPNLSKHSISENEFIRRQDEKRTSSIGIFGAPGSGKSLLLTSLARKYATRYPDRVIGFIRLSQIEPQIKTFLELSQQSVNALDYILYFLTPNLEAHVILKQCVVKGLIRLELFLDEFDEVSQFNKNLVINILQELAFQFKNVGIMLASRDQNRPHLETSLKIISHDILPFNETEQINFLIQYWTHNQEALSITKLHHFAEVCMKQVSRGIAQNDEVIAGIPLQCFLIAEAFSENCLKYCSEKSDEQLNLDDIKPTTLPELYKMFMESWFLQSIKRETTRHIFGSSFFGSPVLMFPPLAFGSMRTSNFKDTVDKNAILMNIKNKWTKLSLKTLFPCQYEEVFEVLGNHDNILFTGFPMTMHQLSHTSDANSFDVHLHRTFAEYLVAEYFVDSFVGSQGNSKITTFFLGIILSTRHVASGEYEFPFFNILYFFNSCFKKKKISKTPLALMLVEQEQKKYEMLVACVYHNFYHIFHLLWKAIQEAPEHNLKTFCEILTESGFQKILLTAINFSSAALVIDCFKFLSQILNMEMTNIVKIVDENEMTPLQLAVKRGSYEVVEFLVHFCSLEDQSLLYWCVQNTYNASDDIIDTRVQIARLLLFRHHDLINDSAQILTAEAKVHVKLLKLVIQHDPNVHRMSKLAENRDNIVVQTSKYMSPSQFHDFVSYLIEDLKLSELFKPCQSGEDVLLKIKYNLPNIQVRTQHLIKGVR